MKDNTLEIVSRYIAIRIKDMQRQDNLEGKKDIDIEDYVLWALEEVESNDGVVIKIDSKHDPLYCVAIGCMELQPEDGEYCETHFIALKNKKPVHNSDYCSYTDDALNEEREHYLDLLESNMSEKGIKNLYELMEIERELTLREE